MLLVPACVALAAVAAELPKPKPSYTSVAYISPAGVKFEVTGIARLPDGRVAVALRKGEVWLLQHPDADPANPEAVGYKRIASGLHEALGFAWHNGALYTMQRSELTLLRDLNGDDVIDDYECAAKGWGVSGNYHEYAYGPVADPQGNLWFTLNATLLHVRKGAFFGHKASLIDAGRPESPVRHPGEIVEGVTVAEARMQVLDTRSPLSGCPTPSWARARPASPAT